MNEWMKEERPLLCSVLMRVLHIAGKDTAHAIKK